MDLRPCSVDQKPVRSSHTLGVGYCCNKPRAQPPTRARKGCILDNYNRINKLAPIASPIVAVRVFILVNS